MDILVVGKILDSLPDIIDYLLDTKEVDEFTFSLKEVVHRRDELYIMFRCGFYNEHEHADEFYLKLVFSGEYSIFYDMKELTYSEQHCGVTLEEPDENRAVKRIINLVWALYKYIYNEMDAPQSYVIDYILSKDNKTGLFMGDWNSAGSPLGTVTFHRA